ncbi:MAG: metal ABC transporter ATP-binding protein [Myxococcales bacterium]|nr:metal ABC transporter ATP-binding protein [Myxococcales bacterium]
MCKRFGDRVVLEDVSFTIDEGELLCLLGPNGAGKSTLVRVALGLLRADAGEARCPASGVGYVPQTKAFSRTFPAKVEELVTAGLRGRWPWRVRASERAKVEAALAQVGAAHLYGASLATLSGGELQRAFLARALVRAPALLVLDEPETGVDVGGRDELASLLRALATERRIAALIVTHHPELVARVADRVVLLDRVVRAWGTPREVLGSLPGDASSTPPSDPRAGPSTEESA